MGLGSLQGFRCVKKIALALIAVLMMVGPVVARAEAEPLNFNFEMDGPVERQSARAAPPRRRTHARL